MKTNQSTKIIFYLSHVASLLKQISKLTMPTFQNYVCSNRLFWLKNNIWESFSTQILAMKVNESIKTIFYLLHYASLLKQVNFKTDHAHFSKLCLLKRVILVNKQHFGIFEPSNNCNKVNKSIKTNFYLAHHASPLK